MLQAERRIVVAPKRPVARHLPTGTRPKSHICLFLVAVESGEKRKLTSPPGNLRGDFYPAVSPDGRAIAFSQGGSLENSSIFICWNCPKTSGPWGNQSASRFGKDARMSRRGGPTETRSCLHQVLYAAIGRLWQMSIRGAARRLRRTRALPFGGESYCAHAGDFPAGPRGLRAECHRCAHLAPGTGRQPAGGQDCPSNSSRLDHVPQYSPDGKRIAFASNRSGSHEIWVCDADGSNAVKLTSFGGPYVADPAWSPDGRRIAFDRPPRRELAKSTSSARTEESRSVCAALRVEMALLRGRATASGSTFAPNRAGKNQVWKVSADGGDPVQITKQAAALMGLNPATGDSFTTRSRSEDRRGEHRTVASSGGRRRGDPDRGGLYATSFSRWSNAGSTSSPAGRIPRSSDSTSPRGRSRPSRRSRGTWYMGLLRVPRQPVAAVHSVWKSSAAARRTT